MSVLLEDKSGDSHQHGLTRIEDAAIFISFEGIVLQQPSRLCEGNIADQGFWLDGLSLIAWLTCVTVIG